MKRGALIAVLVAVVGAAAAQAVTLDPVRQPFARWADEALVATPDVAIPIRVSRAPCGISGVWDCVRRSRGGEVLLWVTPHIPRIEFYAALAGSFDWLGGVIPKHEKRHLARIVHQPWTKFMFEGVFSVCAGTRPRNLQSEHINSAGYFTRHQLRAACRALRSP